jgi:4-hydroxy-3-polyprenylbenzoate decarboxylase
MLRVQQAGAVILPPSPGFYHQPRTIDDLIGYIVNRIMDHLGIESNIVTRWGSI